MPKLIAKRVSSIDMRCAMLYRDVQMRWQREDFCKTFGLEKEEEKIWHSFGETCKWLKAKGHCNLRIFESSVFGTPEMTVPSSPTAGEWELSRPMSVPEDNLRSVSSWYHWRHNWAAIGRKIKLPGRLQSSLRESTRVTKTFLAKASTIQMGKWLDVT